MAGLPMTDDERRACNDAWIKWSKESPHHGRPDVAFDQGYAAGIQKYDAYVAKYIELSLKFDLLMPEARDRSAKACFTSLLEAERARSEWLLEILESYAQDVHRSIVTGDLKVGQLP